MGINEDLYHAVEVGDFDDVKSLVEKGANVNFINSSDDNWTPLHNASAFGHLEI